MSMKNRPAASSLDRRAFCISSLAAAGAAGASALSADRLLAQAPRKKAKVKEPQPVVLQTKDGVALHAVYFAGNRGKESVPIILVHGFEQRGVVWEPLAGYFQRVFGHAVIVPDLRGHGQSTTQLLPRMLEPRMLDTDDLTLMDLANMKWDLHACKKYLEDENNKGELNINMLCVIGAEFGALVAMHFTAMDWSWPVLTTGKQGQDVKGLALLTPLDRFKRMNASSALQGLRVPAASGQFSLLLMAGAQDRGGVNDAERLKKQAEIMFPRGMEGAVDLVTPPTNSHGTQLIEPQRRLGMERELVDFINQRIVARKADFEWSERRSPLER